MLLFLLLPPVFGQSYICEPPVKLLTADLFGDLFPAAASQYRVSSNGHDQNISLTDLEEANRMPWQELVLPPGGEAVFILPMKEAHSYLMMKPGKKEGGSGSPFMDKANITVTASLGTWGSGDVSVECSRPTHDSSSSASRYCTLNLTTLQETQPESIKVSVTVPEEETRSGFLWQLHLSPLDDSERVQAQFTQEGRKLMRRTQEDDTSDTWLTMVSIVGNTGVGKSTVASLLSGNDTMFKSQGSSGGTTTIGADISPIIPSTDYSIKMEEVLGQGPLHKPNQTKPLFLIDSEGMSFRGDEVDFVTTGPVAIVANIIVWITTGRMRPPEILDQIKDYMDGLDRITMGDTSSWDQKYGEFIVVLNMMQEADQDYSDEQLLESLMAWGSSDEEDEIRTRMMMKFKEIVCVGLPSVDNPPVTYPSLENYPRFKEGLMKLGNRVLRESETALNVTVGETKYEMNSDNAETIIGMLIDAANEGNIDLSDVCNVLFSMSKETVIQELGKMTQELEMATEGLCDNASQSCTLCACEYKNSAVDFTLSKLKDAIYHAQEEAETLCEDPKIKDRIGELLEDLVVPWTTPMRCNATVENFWQFGRVCDISELKSVFEEEAGNEFEVDCDILHICGHQEVHNTELSLVTGKVFLGIGASIEQNPPEKALIGVDGETDAVGGEGSAGEAGKGMKLAVRQSLLTGSAHQLVVTLHGGEGGDGGQGGAGRPGIPGGQGEQGAKGANGANGTKGADGHVFNTAGTSGDPSGCSYITGHGNGGAVDKYGKEDHCCHAGCHTYKYRQGFSFIYFAQSPCDDTIDGKPGTDGHAGEAGGAGGDGAHADPGTQGADGGKGGGGGEAGRWVLEAEGLPINPVVQRNGGAGGAGGLPGPGGDGALGGKGGAGGAGGVGGSGGAGGAAGHCDGQDRQWTAQKNWHDCHHCHHLCGCSTSHCDDACSGFAKGTFSAYRPYTMGKNGGNGSNGAAGAQGAAGDDGNDATSGETGSAGDPGQDAASSFVKI